MLVVVRVPGYKCRVPLLGDTVTSYCFGISFVYITSHIRVPMLGIILLHVSAFCADCLVLCTNVRYHVTILLFSSLRSLGYLRYAQGAAFQATVFQATRQAFCKLA